MPPTPGHEPAPLADLSTEQLLERYRAIDLTGGDAADAHTRAQQADRIAAEFLRRHPEEPAMWFDRGLYAKWRRDWAAAHEHSARALQLTPTAERDGQPAAWNLGIAATARRDWPTAREAWRAFGVPLAGEGADPIIEDFGPTPVRLNPVPRYVGQRQLEIDGRAWDTEVVWGVRVDPARIRVVSVPLPESGHRYGDVVLHDGEPQGSREMNGAPYPVFDEIELWERSPHPTSSIQLRAADDDVRELLDDLDAAGLTAEDWTTEVRILCRACSEGSPEGHSHPFGEPAGSERRIGISGSPAEVEPIVEAWRRRGNGRDATEVTVELE